MALGKLYFKVNEYKDARKPHFSETFIKIEASHYPQKTFCQKMGPKNISTKSSKFCKNANKISPFIFN